MCALDLFHMACLCLGKESNNAVCVCAQDSGRAELLVLLVLLHLQCTHTNLEVQKGAEGAQKEGVYLFFNINIVFLN